MSELEANDAARRFDVRTTSDSHFSWLRTRLSLERTLMSWVRTSISLIGFGFTIVQFFQHLPVKENVANLLIPEAPRYLGLAMIGMGVIALCISVWQYLWSLKYLWGAPFDRIAGVRKTAAHTPLLAVCTGLILIGLFAFGAILARVA